MSATDNTLLPLQRVQNAATRLITNSIQRDHIIPVIRQPHWLPINLSNTFRFCLMMHSIITQQFPDYMSEITMSTAVSSTGARLRSAEGLSFWKPKVRTQFCERACSYSGSVAWSSVPYDLQSISDTNSFKHQLKTQLVAADAY